MNYDALRQVILEVLEAGDPDHQDWAFYENHHPLSNWNRDDAGWERNRFCDAVIEKLRERQ